MAELILRLGNRIIFSRRHQCVRMNLISVLLYILLAIAVVFVFEIVVIAFGLEDIFLPLKRETLEVLSAFFYK